MPIPLPEHLTKITPWRSSCALMQDWMFIGAYFAGAMYFPHPVVYLTAAVLIARTQLALAVMMHECAHGVFTKNLAVNDFIGQVFTAAPLMLSLFAYRKGHLQHHKAPMAADDPVVVLFGIGDYPISRRELIGRLFKDLTSLSYFLSTREFIIGRHRKSSLKSTVDLKIATFVIVSIVAMNSLLVGLLTLLGHPWLYLGLWILPAITLLQVFARIRAITEHAGYPPEDDQRKNARSIIHANWQTFFVGPHLIHFHIEHHQYVQAPFYHLKEIHHFMKSQGTLPASNLYRDYWQVFKDVTT